MRSTTCRWHDSRHADRSLQRDIQSVAAYVDSGRARASASVRTGGTSTADALAMNAAKELGRTFGELKIRQQQRNASMDTMNSLVKSNALQMAQFANQTAKVQTSMAQTRDNLKAEGTALENQAARLNNQAGRSMISADRLQNTANKQTSTRTPKTCSTS